MESAQREKSRCPGHVAGYLGQCRMAGRVCVAGRGNRCSIVGQGESRPVRALIRRKAGTALSEARTGLATVLEAFLLVLLQNL